MRFYLISFCFHQLEHVSWCHNIRLLYAFPQRHDFEMSRALFYFIVEKYPPVTCAELAKNVFLERGFHRFNDGGSYTRCSVGRMVENY